MSLETESHKLSMVTKMLALQDGFNQRLFADWKTRGLLWHRALWMEAAEMMDREGWKWWKAAPAEDLAQQQIELVDLWHFILSEALESTLSAEALLVAFESGFDTRSTKPRQDLIEDFVQVVFTPNVGRWVIEFGHLCNAYALPFARLFELYVAKNLLNVFRNQNGYKEGSYRKHWSDGREDNEHLTEVLQASLAAPANKFESNVMAELARRYAV